MAPQIPALVPVLFYQDVRAALDWLEDKFSFQRDTVFQDGNGSIIHAELTLGQARIMIGPLGLVDWTSTPQNLDGQTTQQLYLYVGDVDSHHAHALKRGANIMMPPEEQFYGDRIYRVTDHEGHRWIFGQHLRDVSKPEMAKATGLKVT